MLEAGHRKQLAGSNSLGLRAEFGGRHDGEDADRGWGAEAGFHLGLLNDRCGLDVPTFARPLVAHVSGYRDWGVGVQFGWAPGRKVRGVRVSVAPTRGHLTAFRLEDCMEAEIAHGKDILGRNGLLTSYSRFLYSEYRCQVRVGAEVTKLPQLSFGLPMLFNVESIHTVSSDGRHDRGGDGADVDTVLSGRGGGFSVPLALAARHRCRWRGRFPSGAGRGSRFRLSSRTGPPLSILRTVVFRCLVPRSLLAAACLCLSSPLLADDWPEWRGAGRRGEWRESGALSRFPAQGLSVLWRAPIGSGYAGPSVSEGRVFVTDFRPGRGREGSEGLSALDHSDGEPLWSYRWPADYAGIQYASGPRATPTVDGDFVYALGAAGTLVCASVRDGSVRWQRSFTSEFGTELPPWGMAGAPIVHGDLLIAVVYGRPRAKVVAFDKASGEEVWRALSSEDSGPGYSQPILIRRDGRPLLIVWHAGGLAAIEPGTGAVIWERPYRIRLETPIATPVWSKPHLLVSAFFNGSRLYRLGESVADLLWSGSSESGIETDGLHALMNSPVIDGDFIYGICSYGQLRCLRLATGERVWETQAVTGERARNASAFIVRNGGRYFISNDRGELIIARLSPAGYDEVSRTPLIRPTSKPGARRELGAVNWSHPAYAGLSVFARNDEEILRASLASD